MRVVPVFFVTTTTRVDYYFTRLLGGEWHKQQKCSTTFIQRTKKGHRQSDQHWIFFKGNTLAISERKVWAHVGLPGRIDTILNRIELN